MTALRLDGRGEDLFLGTSARRASSATTCATGRPGAADDGGGRAGGDPITALEFLIGDRTLVVGDAGRCASRSWQVVPPPTGGPARLTRDLRSSPRTARRSWRRPPRAATRASSAATPRGGVHLNYGTSGATLLDAAGRWRGAARRSSSRPRPTACSSADGRGRVGQWRARQPAPRGHPQTLFGKVWYEGYSAARRTSGSRRAAPTTSRPSSA